LAKCCLACQSNCKDYVIPQVPSPPSPPVLQVFLTDEHLVMVLEYLAGGDLADHVLNNGGLPEDEARWIFQQVLFALEFTHRMVRIPVHACFFPALPRCLVVPNPPVHLHAAPPVPCSALCAGRAE
jgi:serine/threonine protein kinase